MNIVGRMFLVIEDERLLRSKKVKYSGESVIMDIGTDVPVIIKGEGCVGVTQVTSIYIDETGTEIGYGSLAKISEADAKAYYKLYRSMVTSKSASNRSGNDYDDNYGDMIMPGLFRPKAPENKTRRSRYEY